MRYMVVGLNYGCEITPVLDALRGAFPDLVFTVEHEISGVVGLARDVFVTGAFDAKEFDHMRALGVVARAVFHKGYAVGLADARKYGTA